MPGNAHDPPATPPQEPGEVSAAAPAEVRPDLTALRGRGFEKYAHVRTQLRGDEPIELIRLMKTGGYRFKSKRGKPGVLVVRRGEPVADWMSFRQIAPELERLTGVPVTYETVRRWWEAAYPDGDPSPVPGAVPPTPNRRQLKRRQPAASAQHTRDIRAATEKARSGATNPDVPAAAFLPPAD